MWLLVGGLVYIFVYFDPLNAYLWKFLQYVSMHFEVLHLGLENPLK